MAHSSLPWPGDAGVAVSVVCIAIGLPTPGPILDGQPVPRITSFLAPRGEEHSAAMLNANRDVSVRGNMVMGIGFVFDDDNPDATPLHVMRRILADNPHSRDRIWRYVGGEDLNSDPRQTSNRYVIDFGELDEAAARQDQELFAIVEAKVKPARSHVGQRDRREQWWRHANRSPVFRTYVNEHKRAIAASQVSSHLAFTFVHPDVVLAHTCVILLLTSDGSFAVAQSRVHEAWALFFASSLEERLRYTPTECFETFAFPRPEPRAIIPVLEDIGKRLYQARAQYMTNENVGLTITYNRLKDRACDDPRILELRKLHEEMDQKVLAAYAEANPEGHWLDVEVPPFCPMNDGDKKKLEKFEDAVIDRLFALNAKRAEEEKVKGLGPSAGKKGAAKKSAGTPGGSSPTRKPRAKKKKVEEQLELVADEESS